MAYNNNYNRNSGRSRGYQNGGGYNNNGGGYNNANNYGGPRNQGQNVKKSGAVYSRMKAGKYEGEMCVNAWRKTRHGLMTASAFPVDAVEHIADKSGKTFLRYVVEVSNKELGTSQTYWCLMQKESKKIFIKELGLVISPNGNGVTASGKRVTGFFGKAF